MRSSGSKTNYLSASNAQFASALEWQFEIGADEAIGDKPIDRTKLPATKKTEQKAISATAESPVSAGVLEPDTPPSNVTSRSGASARRPNVVSPRTLDLNTPETDPAVDARLAASAATDIPSLKNALLNFNGSSLKAGALNTVFADGYPSADLMVIGEAPGREEDRQGLPFVGRSGQLLDRMLAAIGRDRRSEDPQKGVYITNVVPYRPLENRTPEDREVRPLLPFIGRHIVLARPKILLCVGNVPCKYLMEASTGITRFRGTWRDVSPPEVDDSDMVVPALATFHPAFLLRSPDMKRFAWRDLLSLAERLRVVG